MADVTVKVVHKTSNGNHTMVAPIADGVTLYEGQLIGLEGGYANLWADGANDVFAGVLIGGNNEATFGTYKGDTSASPLPQARIDCSGVVLEHLDSVGDTPSQAKVGDLVYCGSSNTDDMTLESSGRTNAIGILWFYRSSTDVDVKLFTPAEALAYNV
jgi:hypothetical protein